MTADQVAQVESSLGWTSMRQFPGNHRTRSRAASGFLFVPALVPVLLLALSGRSAAQDTWTPTSTTNPPAARNAHTAVWTGSKMVVWGGSPDGSSGLDTGSVYDPVADAWTTTSTTNAPTGRNRHTAVWTGSRMIVWGGAASGWVSTGGVYDPVTDGWTAISPANAPTARYHHVAVWTGSKMVIWGGSGGSGHVNTGGVYDPVTDKWAATSTANAPAARYYHTAVWTGSKMVIWGGWGGSGGSGYVNTGAVYDPVTDKWTATSTTNAPTPRAHHAAVWTGSKMVIWGGYGGSGHVNTGAVYDPTTDNWTAMSTTNAPAGRAGQTAIWTGSRMVVWGGVETEYVNTGGLYDPATDTWAATSTTSAPTPRTTHTAVWTGSRMVVWGGWDGSVLLNTGGVYSNPALLPPEPTAADFYTVTPCRLIDTRNSAGPSGGPALVAGAVRGFPVSGICAIPSTASAVSVNLTVTRPAAQGHLILYSGDAAGPPPVSNINFTPGVTRANNAIIPLAADGGTINVMNKSTGSVDLVLDVTGYFQ